MTEVEAECTRGFGRITDPATGTEYVVERDETITVSRDVFERLDAEYSGMVVVSEREGSETPVEDSVCGVEMTDGSTCERPAGECPYHS